jgi:ATP-dependent RNA helicase DeaD
VAARGIDLPTLSLVIHADLPNDAESLQHRSGRTGRAGRKGVSVLLVPPSRRRRAESLLAMAGVHPVWGGPPTADEIRKLDQERLLQDPILAEDNSEEDLGLAQAILAERSPEDVAAALVRLYRSRLPSPEEVVDPGQAPAFQTIRKPRFERREDGPRAGGRDASRPDGSRSESRPAEGSGQEGGIWFRLDIGRRKNADPRWLLPMLCRRGGIQKQDIGAIRIFDRETKFEVRGEAAQRFAEAIRTAGSGDGGRIERATEAPSRAGPGAQAARERESRGPEAAHEGAGSAPMRRQRKAAE